MVRDLSIVKEALTTLVHDKYDHGFIVAETDREMLKAFGMYFDPEHMEHANPNNWKVIIVPFYPTAECLARQIFEDMFPELPGLLGIRVWETPTSVAEYWSDRT
jgi:6-pyruvoyl-tetrahydropterin synthase